MARQTTTTKALAPVERLKTMLRAESVQEQFDNALREHRGPFIASLIDIYANDRYLQECDPRAVIMEALKAATLKLPINRQLGFAWLVPYKTKGVAVPQFQLGYRGYIQLAMRTGQYKHINADVVYEGELVKADKLTGELDLSGPRKSDKVTGYFAYIETTNGFRKTVYWTKEDVTTHAKRYSKSYAYKDGAWQTNFDAMALKTVIRHLLGHYGILSIEMMNAMAADRDAEEESAFEQATCANQGDVIDVQGGTKEEPAEESETAAGDKGDPETPAQQTLKGGPDF